MQAFLDLAKHEIIHLLLSFLAGAIVIFLFKSKTTNRKDLIIWSIIGGLIGEFMIDVDHLFDYFLAYGLNFRLDYFLKGEMFDKLGKSYVPLHAWEWVVVLIIIAYFVKNKKWQYFLFAVALGIFFHLVYDTYYNHYLILGYSLIFRIINNFDLRLITYP